jgi:hypothetical protein
MARDLVLRDRSKVHLLRLYSHGDIGLYTGKC